MKIVFALIVTFIFLATAVGTYVSYTDLANSQGIKTDLGYEVCGAVGGGRNTWESCFSSTAAGTLIFWMAMGLGVCAAYGAYTMLVNAARRRRLRKEEFERYVRDLKS